MRRPHPAGPPAALALAALVLLPGAAAGTTGPTATPTLTPTLTPGTTAGPAVGPSVTPSPGPSAGRSTGPSAGPSGEPADEADAGLEVLSVLPAELRPGGRVVVRGRVTGGGTGLGAATVEVRRASTRISSVSALERWTAAVDPRPGPSAGEEFDDPAGSARTELVVEVGDVAPGASVPFTATLDAAEVGLRETTGAAGAYGLQLVLLADGTDGATGTADDPAGTVDPDEPVDDERGFLVWSPEVDVAPTRLSTTLLIDGPPPLAATGLPDPAVLLEGAAPDGRLTRLVGAAGALDADWVVDPVLLAGMAVTADPTAGASLVPPSGEPGQDGGDALATQQPGDQPSATDQTSPQPSGTAAGGPTDGTGGPAATVTPGATGTPPTGPSGSPAPSGQGTVVGPATVATGWLDALGAARGDREVVLADWADPDPARLRSADDPADAWATLRTAQQAALPDALAGELLAGDLRTDVIAATERGLSSPDLLTLAQGRSSVLLPEELVPLSDRLALTYTPDAVTEVEAGGQELTAVLDDASLSADTASAVEGSPLALTRVLARLATTTLQRPNDPRLLAASLPPDLDPAPGAAEDVADALASTAWAETVPLSTALGTPPSQEPREALPDDRAPDVEGVQELLDAVADGREVAAAVASPQDPVAVAALDLRAAATLSRSAEEDAAAELAGELREQTSGTVAGVQVVPGSRVTLVAAQAALPVTVVNDLGTEVALVLEVRSRSPRLQVPESRVPVTVAPGQRAVVDVPVVAVASGSAEVTSQLMTAGGRPWGEESAVTVTVATQAEGRVLTGVGIGVAVLFVLGSARAFVRNRRGRELAGAGPVEP